MVNGDPRRLIAPVSSAAALAQQSGAATSATVTSELTRASLTRKVQTSATLAIDKGTRTVTLKTPQGDTVKVTASDAVKNVDPIKIRDIVIARYTHALALSMKNAAGNPN